MARAASIPFGQRIASRRYQWVPPVGARRPVELEIGSPVAVSEEEWACPFRITGLPKRIDMAAHGVDAVQALELALVGAARMLSRSPQFRAGQIEKALSQLREAVRLEPDRTEAWYLLGQAALRAGRREEAHQALVAFQQRRARAGTAEE